MERNLHDRPRTKRAVPRAAVGRRDLLRGAIGAGLLSLLDSQGSRAQSSGTRIWTENQKPGDPSWPANPSFAREIEGYAGAVSAYPGDTVPLYVSTSARQFTLSVYRMGWYGGAGARLIGRLGPFSGGLQPIPAPDPATGLLECTWRANAHFAVGADWLTGVYMLRIEAANRQSFIPLIVKNPTPPQGGIRHNLLFQCSTATWQAYNYWGSESLYTSKSGGARRPRAYIVSFDRPYARGLGYYSAGPGAGDFFRYEYAVVRWLERQGFEVDYWTDNDTHERAYDLLSRQAFLSVGHDEYWSKEMRDGVEAARDVGVHLVFLSANTCYWQVRFAASPNGPNRRIVCYKDANLDPLHNKENDRVTTLWRAAPVNRPEGALVGIMYQSSIASSDSALQHLNVVAEGRVDFPGVGGSDGNLHLALGHEYDTVLPIGATLAPLELIASSPVLSNVGIVANAFATRYISPSRARVFAAGTMGWGRGLDPWNGTTLPSRQMHEVLLQVIGDVSVFRRTPAPRGVPLAQRVNILPQALLRQSDGMVSAQTTVYAPPGAGIGFTATLGGSFVPVGSSAIGWSLSGASGWATINSRGLVRIAKNAPEGLQFAVTAANPAYTGADASARVVVQTPVHYLVRVLAGGNQSGYVDGPGASARFAYSVGAVSDLAGGLLIADCVHNVIRRVAPDGTTTTICGSGLTGHADGPALRAQFDRPTSLAWLGSSLLILDSGNHVVRKLSATGMVSTVAGSGVAGLGDGDLGAARFNFPMGITVDPSGQVYVADALNHCIRMVSGNAVTTIAGNGEPGFVDGVGQAGRLYLPCGVAWSGQELLIADTGNHSIRRWANGVLSTVAGTGQWGTTDGAVGAGTFNLPLHVHSEAGGQTYVTDFGNNLIRRVDLRTGDVSTAMGSGLASAQPLEGVSGDRCVNFMKPVAVVPAPLRRLYVVDMLRVYAVEPKQV